MDVENHFCKTLNGKISRRTFLKLWGLTTIPLLLRINVFNKESPANRIACKNCGAIIKDTRIYFLDWLLKDPVRYCYNCGIELRGLRYKIIRNLTYKDKIKTKRVDSGYYTSPIYYQVPFPNFKYLVKSNKPEFKIADIKH